MENANPYNKTNYFLKFIKDLPENNKTNREFTDEEFNNCLNKWISETKYHKNEKHLLDEYIFKKANQILDDIISKRESN